MNIMALNAGLIIVIASIMGCSSETISPICSMELKVNANERANVLETFRSVGNKLGMQYKGYDQDFPSGTNVTVAVISISDKSVASIMEMDQKNVFFLSIYNTSDKVLLKNSVMYFKNVWGDKLKGSESCRF